MGKIYLLLLCIFCCVSSFSQTTVTLTADRDNTIYSENGALSNGSGSFLFAGRTNQAQPGIRRALVHFDLSGIPATATITSATLRLLCNKTAAASAGIAVHALTAAWGEGTSNANGQEGTGASATTNDATWSNRLHPSTAWGTPGGSFNATASATVANVSSGIVAISSAALIANVQSFVTTPANNFGWVIRGSAEGTNATALRFGSSEHADPSERPELEVTYTTGPVPVVLAAFRAKLVEKDVLLQWSTLTEDNNLMFEIEHSRNGQQFKTVGQVKGQGTTTEAQEYHFAHRLVPAGKNYYRLAQYNLDRTVTYSPTVMISSVNKEGVELFPNPAKGLIKINAAFMLDKAMFKIMNNNGQMMQSGTLQNAQLNIGNLPVGQYHLLITTADGENVSAKFLKN